MGKTRPAPTSEAEQAEKNKRKIEADNYLEYLRITETKNKIFMKFVDTESEESNIKEEPGEPQEEGSATFAPTPGALNARVQALLGNRVVRRHPDDGSTRIRFVSNESGIITNIEALGEHKIKDRLKLYRERLNAAKYAGGLKSVVFDYNKVEFVRKDEIDAVLAMAREIGIGVQFGNQINEFLYTLPNKLISQNDAAGQPIRDADGRTVTKTEREWYKVKEAQSMQAANQSNLVADLVKTATFKDRTSKLEGQSKLDQLFIDPKTNQRYHPAERNAAYLRSIVERDGNPLAGKDRVDAVEAALKSIDERCIQLEAAREELKNQVEGLQAILNKTPPDPNAELARKVLQEGAESRNKLIQAMRAEQADLNAQLQVLKSEKTSLVTMANGIPDTDRTKGAMQAQVAGLPCDSLERRLEEVGTALAVTRARVDTIISPAATFDRHQQQVSATKKLEQDFPVSASRNEEYIERVVKRGGTEVQQGSARVDAVAEEIQRIEARFAQLESAKANVVEHVEAMHALLSQDPPDTDAAQTFTDSAAARDQLLQTLETEARDLSERLHIVGDDLRTQNNLVKAAKDTATDPAAAGRQAELEKKIDGVVQTAIKVDAKLSEANSAIARARDMTTAANERMSAAHRSGPRP